MVIGLSARDSITSTSAITASPMNPGAGNPTPDLDHQQIPVRLERPELRRAEKSELAGVRPRLAGFDAFDSEIENFCERRNVARIAGLAPRVDLRGQRLVELQETYSRSKRSTGSTNTVAPPTSTSSG